jgi:DNA repair photolyase
MKAIYEPKGRAKEYAELACNLYTGCAHDCRYCWAPNVLHKTREEFHEVKLRPGILEVLERDCKRMAGDPREILFCFTCDPYPPFDKAGCLDVTTPALRICARHNMHAIVLTKAGTRAAYSFDLLKQHGFRFGTSLSFVLDEHRREWEPNAASVENRIEAIQQAHERGIQTWVSIEPVIYAAEALRVIQATAPFVDHFKIGKLNHMPEREKEIDWTGYARAAKALLESLGKSYYIKNDLRKFLD